MHAYNSLNDTQRGEWVQIEQDHVDGLLTEKGYWRKMNKLYEVAFNLPKDENKMKFSSVESCNEEFEKLSVRVKTLERRLRRYES